MKRLTLSSKYPLSPTRDGPAPPADSLPPVKEIKVHPTQSTSGPDPTNASIYFIGTATTILEYGPFRIMTDPNFLHSGDHVHLGPGVTATRKTDPAMELDQLPAIDLVLLSHYHEDHFDRVVEARLRRDLPIVTTKHAKENLDVGAKGPGEGFSNVVALQVWESVLVEKEADGASGDGGDVVRKEKVSIRGMPGKHIPVGVVNTLNSYVGAVPPTNGWMIELGHQSSSGELECGYRIYISGDTLLISELSEIPIRYAGKSIDLMLVHLGGTTIPGPHLPLLMVTMDADQGVKLMRLINPDLTVPIHYDDYDVFLSSLEEFKKMVKEAGLDDKVVYLDRKDQYRFKVKGPAYGGPQ